MGGTRYPPAKEGKIYDKGPQYPTAEGDGTTSMNERDDATPATSQPPRKRGHRGGRKSKKYNENKHAQAILAIENLKK